MNVELAYGKKGLRIDLSDDLDTTVIEPTFVPGVPDPHEAIRDALRYPQGSQPLRDVAASCSRVALVVNDITRPTPYRTMLPVLLQELGSAGEVTIFVALGTHRKNTDDELREILGDEVVRRFRIVQNDAFDQDTQVCIGTSSRGHEIWINREFLECDVKVLTGFIEPHFFAGFSGGGKAVIPGMAGLNTVLGNHDAQMIDDRNAVYGVTEGNPIWEEIMEIAALVGKSFLVNITLNREQEITGVFAGDLREAYGKGCAFVKEGAMVPVDRPFDIVITSNSGHPLDLNLYQAVKGMSAAGLVVREGGSIIVAADCWDGIPEHGLFGQMLMAAGSPEELLRTIRKPGFQKQDQWQVQILLKLLKRSDIYIRSGNLTDKQLRAVLLKPAHRIETTVDDLLKKYGRDARICVLPEGPQTIPYVHEA